MTKRILLVAAIFAATLGVAWWIGTLSDAGGIEIAEKTAESTGSSAGLKDAVSPTVVRSEASETVIVSDSVLSRIQKMEVSWAVRYPESEVLEERVMDIGGDRFRRQLFLKTKVERIPWVLWEETLQETESGEVYFIKSTALVGNVIYVDADPEWVPQEELNEFVEANDLYIERESRFSEYKTLGLRDPSLEKLSTLLDAFRARFPGVIAELEPIYFSSALPSDWAPARMWGLENIDAPDAWDFETGEGAEEVVVAIIDTGVETTHLDLSANILDRGFDFVDDDSIPQDNDGHGTHVAGIVGAVGDNGIGAVGVSWNVKILPLRVGDESGLRNSAINDALAYVTRLKNEGVNIVATNNSYGSSGYSAATRSEIVQHQELGVLFVAAAGNDGTNIDLDSQYPAGYELSIILSVASSNQEDGLNGSSNYGATNVDLSAPGSGIYSTYPGNSYEFLSGTSMASPMVAGAVALVAQANPGMTASQIKARLMESVDPIRSQAGRSVSGGRLNILSAIKPELAGHEVRVSNIADALVLVDDIGTRPIFDLESLPDAIVSAQIVEGAEVGTVTSLGNNRFRFNPLVEGQARIRFDAALSGIVRSVYKTVIVGESGDVSSGLIHHFEFDGSGSNVADTAGSSNGTLVGAVKSSSDFGSAASFDAPAEKMSFNGTLSRQVTIAALVKSENLSSSPHPRIVNMPFYYLYFSTGTGSAAPDGNRETLKFYSHFETGSVEAFGVWNAPPSIIDDNKWYYVVGTYNSSSAANTPSLYLNGAEQVVRMQQEPRGSFSNPGGLSYVGNNEASDRSFNGLIADVRIYDRMLTGGEVSQLGGHLLADSLDGFEISGPETPQYGPMYEYSLSGHDENGTTVRWFVDGGVYTDVLEETVSNAGIRFLSSGDFSVQAQVSNGLATKVVSKMVTVRKPSYYTGATANGGIVLLNYIAEQNEGTITIVDPESGYYRLNEAVTFLEDGSFFSAGDGEGSITGNTEGGFSGSVAGYDITFSGDALLFTNDISEFRGRYYGGALGVLGDSVEMEVLSDGRAFLWREGPLVDFAIGSVDREGNLTGLAARGEEITISLEDQSDAAKGTWGDEALFVQPLAEVAEGLLNVSAFGGYVRGEGVGGLFAQIGEPGEPLREDLAGGDYVWGDFEDTPKGKFMAMYLPYRVGVYSPTDLLDSEFLTEHAGLWETGTRAGNVRLQVPVGVDEPGALAFSVVGEEPCEVLLRALGPAFSDNALSDPRVSLYRVEDAELSLLGSNDDWMDGIRFAEEDDGAQGAFEGLEAVFESLGIRTLGEDSSDAAARVWLEPGDYLLLIETEAVELGSGLLELYELR